MKHGGGSITPWGSLLSILEQNLQACVTQRKAQIRVNKGTASEEEDR